MSRGKVTATHVGHSFVLASPRDNKRATISRAHSIGCGEIVKVTVMVMPHPRAPATTTVELKESTPEIYSNLNWAVESSGYFIAYQLCVAYYNVTIGTNH